jgi:hypothetical protein
MSPDYINFSAPTKSTKRRSKKIKKVYPEENE